MQNMKRMNKCKHCTRSFIIMLTAVLATFPAMNMAYSPKFWDIQELVAYSDVVAVVELISIEKKANDGLIVGPNTHQVSAYFQWIEVLQRGPYVDIDQAEQQLLSFSQSEFGTTPPGEYLVFLRQVEQRKYSLVADESFALFRFEQKKPTEELSAKLYFRGFFDPKSQTNDSQRVTRTGIKKLLKNAVIVDQEQSLELAIHGLHKVYKEECLDGQCRLTLHTRNSPGGISPDFSESVFGYTVAGYCDCSWIENLIAADALKPLVHESILRVIVKGCWESGYFMIQEFEDKQSGQKFIQQSTER